MAKMKAGVKPTVASLTRRVKELEAELKKAKEGMFDVGKVSLRTDDCGGVDVMYAGWCVAGLSSKGLYLYPGIAKDDTPFPVDREGCIVLEEDA